VNDMGRRVLGAGFFATAIFLILPFIAVTAAAFSPVQYVSFPPTGFSFRWFMEIVNRPVWISAIITSAVIALVVAFAVTLASAFALMTLHSRGWSQRSRIALGFLASLPLLVPHVAIGIAMLAFSRSLGIGGTVTAIAIAHIILAIPFAYAPIANSFAKMDPNLVHAAMTLGANSRQAFWQVVLPTLRPGMTTAFIFSFLSSFDEVTVSLFLIGPNIDLLPVRVLMEVQQNDSPVVAAISLVMIAIMLVALTLVERVAGMGAFTAVERTR